MSEAAGAAAPSPHVLPDATPGTAALRRCAATLRRLAVGIASAMAAAATMLWLGPMVRGLTDVHAAAQAALDTGAAGAGFASLLLALGGLIACLAMLRPPATGCGPGGAGAWVRRPGGLPVKRRQGSIVPALALGALASAWLLRPTEAQPAAQDSFALAAVLLALAFLALVAERMVAAIRPAVLPEAASLRTLMLLPVLALGGSALVQLALGAALPHAEIAAPWVGGAIDFALGLIALELALRALAVWFLPAPSAAAARAAVDSLFAQMLAGSVGRGGVAAPIRAQFGLDFSRSWALLYLRAAALPALLLTALFCWGLTGLVMIDLDQRGVYQRFGAPAAVLHPGLHAILPWPLGSVRRVEFGTVHEIALGGDNARPLVTLREDRGTPEGPPPESASRLWDQPHPGEIATLIASASIGTAGAAAGAAERQSFQIVNADIRVLTRVGLTDRDATAAATLVADPAELVRDIAARRVARSFAVRTLADMLGERREAVAGELRTQIAADLAPFHSGIEVVGVVVEAIHPPAGAAAAYHAVQAAAIDARAAVAEAQGQARSAANETLQQAHQIGDSAQSLAAETVEAAQAERLRFSADAAAARAGGRTFLLERYFADLVTALAKAPLTLLDDRIAGPTAPLIDLRTLAGAATPPADDPD